MGDPDGAKAPIIKEAKAEGATGVPSMAALRRHERLNFAVKVMLYELASDNVPGAPAGGESVDLSRSGIGVRSRRMYYKDRVVLVRIPLRYGGAYFKCGVVRSAVYAADGMYHIGIEFTAMPGGEALAGWMRARQASPGDVAA
jgi:hypothetical protein